MLEEWLQRLRSHWRRYWSLGARGERAAARFLASRGCRVLLRNVALGRGELDLVCRSGQCLVFVEVKTRHPNQRGRPADAVMRLKRSRLASAGHAYLRELDRDDLAYRFDIVEVVWDGRGRNPEIRWIQNAFDPVGY